MSRQRALSAAGTGGLLIFVVIVTYLQWLRADYDPRTQLMSELALGQGGGLMLPAFLGLSGAIAATTAQLHQERAALALTVLLSVAASCFAGAGVISLEGSAEIHIFFVAAAFVCCGLSMYLLPQQITAFSAPLWRLASWSAAVIMAGTTALGGNYLAPGIAQRLAAAALLFWLLIINGRFSRDGQLN